MSQIVGIGACVADTLILLPEFPTEDTKLRALSVKQCGGGPVSTGLTVASKLGADSAYIGVISDDDSGRFLLEDFRKYGVDISLVQVQTNCRTFTSFIWLSAQKGSRTCVFDKGSLPPLKLNDKHKRAIKSAKILMVDGNELEAAVQAAKLARENGVSVLYDAGGLYEGVEQLLRYTDILIPSEEFAISYTQEDNASMAAKKLYNLYHPKVVVITRGKQGGLLYDGSDFTVYPIYPAKVVDSNGAGDVFHGAFAAGLISGYGYEQCCHFASAVSALKCTGMGARESVPTRSKVMEFLRRNGYAI